MADLRPIGVFDSGVGGLTVLRAIQETLPNESTIYVADLKHFPYGPRPQEEVRVQRVVPARKANGREHVQDSTVGGLNPIRRVERPAMLVRERD